MIDDRRARGYRPARVLNRLLEVCILPLVEFCVAVSKRKRAGKVMVVGRVIHDVPRLSHANRKSAIIDAPGKLIRENKQVRWTR